MNGLISLIWISILGLLVKMVLGGPTMLEDADGHMAEMKYLGLHKEDYIEVDKGTAGSNKREARGGGNVVLTSYYFLSQNSAGWSTAQSDCKAYLGEEATLLYIESQEELRAVTKFLASSDDSGTQYWAGGKYDIDRRAFTWDDGVELGAWLPWDAGYPDTHTAVTRIYLFTAGIRGDQGLKLRTQFQTVSNRYICELKSGVPDEAKPCHKQNDLIVLLDSGSHVGSENFATSLEFTVRLASSFRENSQSRFAVIKFAESAETVFSLNDNLSFQQFRDKVYSTSYMNGQSGGDFGLSKALHEFQTYGSSRAKSILFITNGPSRCPPDAVRAAEKLQVAGVTTYVIGIGPEVISFELQRIAGGSQDNIFKIDIFADLLRLLDPLSRQICG